MIQKLFTAFIALGLLFMVSCKDKESAIQHETKAKEFALAIHGGAGAMPKEPTLQSRKQLLMQN